MVPCPSPLHLGHNQPNELLVLYCPPTKWVNRCWRTSATYPRPRLSPLEWERVRGTIHHRRRPQGGGMTFPSTGIMAVWTALALCHNVTLYGFGACGARVSFYFRYLSGRCLFPSESHGKLH